MPNDVSEALIFLLLHKGESREDQEFSLLYVVQTGCRVHTVSYPKCTGSSFPGGLVVKRPGRETDNSPPDCAEVKKI
jgi:hypothetical protein